MKKYLSFLKKEIICPYCKTGVPLRRCLGSSVVECKYCYEIAMVRNHLIANAIYLLFALILSFVIIFFDFKVSLKYIFPLILLYILGGITTYSHILKLDREIINEPEI